MSERYDEVRIDGRMGEGGGQIVRSSLSLAAVCGRPLRVDHIRAKRQKDGLLRQHLTAVKAVATVCSGRVEGAELRSTALTLVPGAPRGGTYEFAVGTAGSAVLVCQTVLPVLLAANEPSTVVFEGGTHNPMSPPFGFFERIYLPALHEMGARVEVHFERAGFFPAGGGRFVVEVAPGLPDVPFERMEKDGDPEFEAWAISANLPDSIGTREMSVVRSAFGLGRERARNVKLPSPGQGNVVAIELRCGAAVERVTAFGQRRRPAEEVAEDAIEQARAWIESEAPVGEHLADQLILPLAFAGGCFRCGVWSSHAETHVQVVRAFLGEKALGVEHGPDGTVVTAPGTRPG